MSSQPMNAVTFSAWFVMASVDQRGAMSLPVRLCAISAWRSVIPKASAAKKNCLAGCLSAVGIACDWLLYLYVFTV